MWFDDTDVVFSISPAVEQDGVERLRITNLGVEWLGVKVLGPRKTGWSSSNPTGGVSGTFAAYAAPTASGVYSTVQQQALMNAVETNSQRLAALIADIRAHGLIGA